MIKLTRGDEPAILKVNKQTWAQELKDEMDSGLSINQASSSKKYNHPDVKESLMRASFGKCMYCESKVRHVDHGEIEHIRPKSVFPQSVFEWENLGFVCSVCNNKKRDQFDTETPIVDPFVDDPSEHLVPFGPTFFPKPGSNRGQITLITVDLNRIDLVERRREKIGQLHTLLEKANRLPLTLKQAVEAEAQAFVASSEEYSGTAQAAFKAFAQNSK